MKLNKKALGIGIISMSMGMLGCGMNNDNITSRAPNPSNYPTQVRMDTRDNGSDNMKINGRYDTTNRGRVLGPKNTSNFAQYPNMSGMSDTNYGTNNNTSYSRNNGTKYGMNNENERDLAKMDRITREIERLAGYDNVSCVVNGNTAIVGCTSKNNNVTNEQVKNEITSMVKRCEPSITRCEVINNKDGMTKIGRMAEDMRKGNIGLTLSRDFQNMLDDIIR